MSNLPTLKKMQWNLWLFGWVKIPMIAFCRPKIVTWNEDTVVIRIRKSRRTKNHLKSIYFGALMVGADLAAAFCQAASESEFRISSVMTSLYVPALGRSRPSGVLSRQSSKQAGPGASVLG